MNNIIERKSFTEDMVKDFSSIIKGTDTLYVVEELTDIRRRSMFAVIDGKLNKYVNARFVPSSKFSTVEQYVANRVNNNSYKSLVIYEHTKGNEVVVEENNNKELIELLEKMVKNNKNVENESLLESMLFMANKIK